MFSIFSRREAALDKTKRTTSVFDFLLTSLRPRLLFVHGRTAIQRLERLTQTALPLDEFAPVNYAGVNFEVLAGNHLSFQWSDAAVEQLGLRMRDRVLRVEHSK